MATASEALQEKVESARKLQWELTKCQKELEAVKASILARREPDDIRRKFRACQDAMMVLGRLLMLDGRFKPRLPSDLRNEALDMLRAGARPIELQRKLGLDNLTVRRLRHRELNDLRNLSKVRKLSDEQVAEIRAAGRATLRRVFAEKFGVSMSLISKVRNGRASYREVKEASQTTIDSRAPRPTLAKRPSPATKNELTLRLDAQIAGTLAEMAKLAHAELPNYVMELLECGVADFRARNIPATFLDLDSTMPLTAPPAAGAVKQRGRLSREDRDRILMQRAEGVTISELATRWHCGESSIRRALQGAKKKKRGLPAPEVVQQILYMNGHDEFIGLDVIAKKCNVPESVVSAVLSNHKPVTPSSSSIHGRPPRPRPGGWDRYAS